MMNHRKLIRDTATKHGVKRILVRFSGGGDSGGVDYVEFYGAGWKQVAAVEEVVETDIVERSCQLKDGKFVSNVSLKRVCEPLSRFVERIAMDEVDAHNVDWWNNEGGNGSWVMDCESGTVTIEIFVMEARSVVYEKESFDDEDEDDGVGQLCEKEEGVA